MNESSEVKLRRHDKKKTYGVWVYIARINPLPRGPWLVLGNDTHGLHTKIPM